MPREASRPVPELRIAIPTMDQLLRFLALMLRSTLDAMIDDALSRLELLHAD